MSEKGGKGLKSSLKSKDGDKDGNSTKVKKSKQTHFDPQEANYKSVNGFDQQIPSFSSKGGKGDKATKSGKNSLHSSDLKDLPENAVCMMDCEVFQILDGIKGHLVVLSEDPSIKIPVSYDRALAYVESCVQYSNPQSVRKLAMNDMRPLKTHGISDGEMCVIANACPESVDESFAFIPSLKTKKDVTNQPLEDALVELSKLKSSE